MFLSKMLLGALRSILGRTPLAFGPKLLGPMWLRGAIFWQIQTCLRRLLMGLLDRLAIWATG